MGCGQFPGGSWDKATLLELRDFSSGDVARLCQCPQGISVVEFTNIRVATQVKMGKNKGNSPKSSWLLLRPGF